MARDLAAQIAAGEGGITGVMLESFLVAGRQDLSDPAPLTYGQSITDACLGWADSVKLLDKLAEGVRKRRVAVEE